MFGSIRLALYENPDLLHCQKYIPVMEYGLDRKHLTFVGHTVSVLITQLQFRSQKNHSQCTDEPNTTSSKSFTKIIW